MLDLERYDALVDSIYDAGIADGTVSRLFEQLRSAFDAAGAGVSLYDATSTGITHTLVRSDRSISRKVMAQILPMTEDPSAGLVTGTRLNSPRRFTDIVPEPQLRQARWFREQSKLTGMGHGIVFDIEIAQNRVRLFAVRRAGAANFTEAETRFLGRIGIHFQRAFARNLARFSPFAALRGVTVILYDEARLSPIYVRGDAFDRHFAARFHFTPAELRVFKVMVEGVTREEAHARLGISPNSIKTHMRRIYAKTGARRLPELLVMVERSRGPTR